MIRRPIASLFAAAAFLLAAATAASPQGVWNIGNVGGVTKEVCVTPTVTNGTYNANTVVGGLLTFANVFPGAGKSGIIQAVTVNFKTAQTVGFKFYPLSTKTSSTTWTDNSAAAISAADVFAVRAPVALSTADSSLGTLTNYTATMIALSYVSSDANLYGVLVPTATTASLGATSNAVQICVEVFPDL